MKSSNARGMDYIYVPLSPGDWEIISSLLADSGYAPGGQGVRDMLIDLSIDEIDDSDEGEKEPAVNPALQKLFDYVAKNPEAIRGAAAMGKGLFTSILKKKMGL